MAPPPTPPTPPNRAPPSRCSPRRCCACVACGPVLINMPNFRLDFGTCFFVLILFFGLRFALLKPSHVRALALFRVDPVAREARAEQVKQERPRGKKKEQEKRKEADEGFRDSAPPTSLPKFRCQISIEHFWPRTLTCNPHMPPQIPQIPECNPAVSVCDLCCCNRPRMGAWAPGNCIRVARALGFVSQSGWDGGWMVD